MPCFHPLQLIIYEDILDREGKPLRKVFPSNPPIKNSKYPVIRIPCGQCIGCRLDRSKDWAARCVLEASSHDNNCFITLTFNDYFLPADNSIHKRDIQLFMKRLRKKFGAGIRFFACGEYGELLERPHYHAILFGFDFPDKVPFSVRDGNTYYISETLMKLWPYGFSTIGQVTFESCAYVARYVCKKITGDKAAEHYKGREPEFLLMSRKPGIAKQWFDEFQRDVYPNDFVVVRDGIKQKPPRYFDKLYDVINPDDMARIKEDRIAGAIANYDDNTPARLEVKEELQLLKAKKLIRGYEKGDNING
nr:replication initiation protein [Microvirus sp.]